MWLYDSFHALELYEVKEMIKETIACKVENFKHTWQMNGRVTRTAFQLLIFSLMMSIGNFLRMRYGQQRVQSPTYIQSVIMPRISYSLFINVQKHAVFFHEGGNLCGHLLR